MAQKNVVLLVAGLLLASFNLAVIGTVATGAVDDAVGEALQTYTKDTICADETCEVANSDWATSTSERSYYAWNMTNSEAVMADSTLAPEFEQVGPVVYEIVAERELLSYDSEAGTITYSEVKTYNWVGGVPSTSEVTNLNILFGPQRIGATGTFIGVVASMAQAGFSAGMIENEMEVGVPSMRTAADLSEQLADLTDDLSSEPAASKMMALAGFSAWNNSDAAQALYDSTFIDGEAGPNTWHTPNFSAGILYALNSASDPADATVDISLTSKWGPALFMGLGEPAISIQDLSATLDDHPSIVRAQLFGYLAMKNETIIDVAETFARDQAMYSLVGSIFADNGGGDDEWESDMEEVEDRFFELSGARIGNHDVLQDLLWGMDGNTPRGLLVSDSAGVMWGLALLLSAAQENPFAIMVDYGLGITDVAKIGEYAGNWFLGETTFPMILKGGSGTINAPEYLYAQFAGPNPLTGGYSTASLNIGGLWAAYLGTTYDVSGEVVVLNSTQVENILYGPYGITTDAVVNFLYGEVTGHTLPVDADTMTPTLGGDELTWDTARVAALYDIDENAAAALRYFVKELMFEAQIPGLLGEMFGEEATGFPGATKWVTHTVDQWLFGWRDPLMASLDGDQNNLTYGWQALEANKTYYGSVSEHAPNGVPTGNGTTYVVCTGENDACDTGEILEQDGSPYLFWRTPEMEEETWGEITAESLNGTTGGFITGDGDLVNLGDYAVCSPLQMADSEHLGMVTETWTCHVDGNERLIQAKLTNSHSALDIFPGAIPIYFGADVELKVQPTARVIVAGASESFFYLDLRPMHEQAASEPEVSEMQPVFKIESGGGADAETVAGMQDQIVHNQKQFTYWTNFDTDGGSFYIDQVTATLYLVALILVGMGGVGMALSAQVGGEFSLTRAEEESRSWAEEDADAGAEVGEAASLEDDLLNQTGGAF